MVLRIFIGVSAVLLVLVLLLCVHLRATKKRFEMEKAIEHTKGVEDFYEGVAPTFQGDDNHRFNSSLDKMHEFSKK